MLLYGKCEYSVMQMLYACVHPVAVLTAAFCMTCSLLMDQQLFFMDSITYTLV